MYAARGIASRYERDLALPTDAVYLDRGLSTRTRNNVERFLSLGWHPNAVATRERCSLHAVRNVKENLDKFANTRHPLQRKLGRPSAISDENGEALFDELVHSGWMYQDEIVQWLAIERDCRVSRQAVQRYLKNKYVLAFVSIPLGHGCIVLP
ncbi:hypothetical protein PSPO01_16431 [Paraphaeosphaeria sporulosa]